MNPATAAAPARLGLAAILLASLAAFVVAAGPAEGAGRAWSAYLAPAAACPRASDPAATAEIQRRAISCLLNWARAQDGRGRLARSRPLERAAALKGRRLVSCGELTHAPCGSDPTATLRAAGYRYASFGENLFVGPWGGVSARDVVAAWLRSPTHRANVLRRDFRDVGAALVRARDLMGGGDAAVWIVALASSR